MKSFRVQQTSVVLPEQVNREDLESILSSLGRSIENKLDDLKWKFEGTSIDFSSLENIKDNFPFINEKTHINPVWLAKILFLSSTHGLKSTTIYRAKFDSIAKTLNYLAERNIQHLGNKDLEDYISYLLMHNIDKGRLTKRLTPQNFTTYAQGIDSGTWLKTLKKYRLPLIGFSSNIIDSIGSKSLKNAIETLSAGDLTYRDWKEGGSFNHLTLDYGRYYVEHCDAYFHRYIGVAIALKATLSQAADIASQACRNVNRKNLKSFLTPIIVHFLAGKQISELKPNYRGKLKAVWLVELQKLTLISFEKNLRPLRALDELLSDKETGLLWNQISNESININQREWLKTLIEIWWTLHVNSSSKHSELRRLEFACLVNVIGGNFDLHHINKCIDESYNRLFSEVDVTPLTPSFFESAGIVEKGTISTNVYNLIRYVEDAGIVLFVALTGWRESEFGFSLSNIKIRPNLDLLDQYACPVRYEVQWKVPKTNGNTNVHREITYASYSSALKLAYLVNAGDAAPCLYSYTAAAKQPQKSAEFIKDTIGELWVHFVHNYEPFKQLALMDELEELKNQESQNDSDVYRFNDLKIRSHNEHWERLARDPMLREAHRRAKAELDRVSFFLNSGARRKYVWKYRQGEIASEQRDLLDKYLSIETKDAINKVNSEIEINAAFTLAVSNEIIANCLYPTPHAFRHMWAEAVYRRFDGDAGWMIRSHFKHISLNMWLAYIRNKDNRRQHDRVKRQVISSILINYVSKKGEGYAGAMDRFLRRLFLQTQTVSLDNLKTTIEQYGLLEIEDIKANPWGFCILRKRNQEYAKCADQGIPQRHNASPALCLGCTNNLTQESNIEGIMLGIYNDMEVLKNPGVPNPFRIASNTTVKNALKQLKKLGADKDILDEVKDALKEGGYLGLK